jgi:sugar phosphate isomerase/epimerase
MVADEMNRRDFLTSALAAPTAVKAATAKKIPIGLELYSVRNELKQDLMGTVRTVSKMGYEGVEFYAPYFDWTPAFATDVRKLLDDLGIRCFSTHNGPKSFTAEGLAHAIELNQIIGSKFLIMASAGRVEGADAWKSVAETLTRSVEPLRAAGMRPGYHNHELEFRESGGRRPMEILAENTPKDVVLQFDVGPCVEVGSDPVAWINQNPRRIASMHVKDWAPAGGFQVLLGEGTVPWKQVLAAAQSTGGIEYYLIEQEGSRFTPFETAEKCLASFRKMLASQS